MSTGIFHKFYNSNAWLKTRRALLFKSNFLCSKCNKPADTVHHIIELNEKNITDPNISLNENNLMVVCRDCHNAIHNRFIESSNKLPKRIIKFSKDGYIKTVEDVKPF